MLCWSLELLASWAASLLQRYTPHDHGVNLSFQASWQLISADRSRDSMGAMQASFNQMDCSVLAGGMIVARVVFLSANANFGFQAGVLSDQ